MGNPGVHGKSPTLAIKLCEEDEETCCNTAKAVPKSDSFFEDSRTSSYMRSDLVAQKVVPVSRCCVRGICGQAQYLCIPSKSKWNSLGIRDCSCNFPKHWTARATPQAAPQAPRQTEDSYIFMAPIATPLSAFPIPKTFMMDKSQSTLEATAPGNKAMTIPCFPHKPSQEETPPKSCPYQDPVVRKKKRSVSFSTIRPWHRDFPEPDSSQPLEVSFSDILKDSQSGTESVGPSDESSSLGASFLQPERTVVHHLNEAHSEDDYLLPCTGPSTLLAMGGTRLNAQHVHNPRSPESDHFYSIGCPCEALPSHKILVRRSEIQPPSVYCSLKPGFKSKYTLSLSHPWTTSRSAGFAYVSDGSWTLG
ncbi:GRB2-associated-binding protein 2 [Sciurus carolinensis]|uniref:GRB2-associated-binding protein 2 n=1 Tax=Sciurus carolinensis TaxID=30640 RepID=A0AA41NAJ5_SCICA|nr:GRB2-associated-binding protein 2 [Sciurus carolinensis]